MAKINSNDYYEVLGLDKNCSLKDIKKSYKKLAMKYHPDKNINNKKKAEENFKKVNEAYSVLSDNEKRKKYDQFGKSGLENNGGMSPDMASQIFSQFFGNNGSTTFSFSSNIPNSNMNGFDPFSNFFNFRQGPQFNRSRYTNYNKYSKIKNGTNIIIKNLMNRPDLNNQYGLIKKFLSNNNRYVVQVNNNAISLKRKNIQQLINCKIVNLVTNDKLNNNYGMIYSFNQQKKRFKIQINNKFIFLKPENIIINNNTCIEIYGLLSNDNLNGTYGTIIKFENDRYLVKINSKKVIRLKQINIII